MHSDFKELKPRDLGKMIDGALKGDSHHTMRDIYDELYRAIRVGSYKAGKKDDRNIAEVTAVSADSKMEIDTDAVIRNGIIEEEAHWHSRTSQWKYTGRRNIARVSINAHPDPGLIAILDRFCCKCADRRRKDFVISNYKVPASFEGWLKRYDSVTVYFYDTPSERVLDELSAAVAPYVRGDHLIGKKIARGVYYQEEWTEEEIKTLITRAEDASPPLGAWVRDKATRQRPNEEALRAYRIAHFFESWVAEDTMAAINGLPRALSFSTAEAMAVNQMVEAYECYLDDEKNAADVPAPHSKHARSVAKKRGNSQSRSRGEPPE